MGGFFLGAKSDVHLPKDTEMRAKKIPIRVDTESAKPRRSLEEIMDEMSREAQEGGLTPEILESILSAPN